MRSVFYSSRKRLDRNDKVRLGKVIPVFAGDPYQQRCPPGELSDQ